MKPDIVALVGAEQEVVEVDGANNAVGPNNADFAKRPRLRVGATRLIKGVKNRGQRRKRVGAGPDNFAHNGNTDASDLAQRNVGISAATGPIKALVCLPKSPNNPLFSRFDG